MRMGVELNPKPQTLQLGGQSLVFYHAKVAVSDAVLANRCNKLYPDCLPVFRPIEAISLQRFLVSAYFFRVDQQSYLETTIS
jgi:hypothetical protein